MPEPEEGRPRSPGGPLVPPPAGGSSLPPEPEPPLLEAERIPRVDDRRRAPGVVRVAWVVALATDALQWIVWPLFVAGAASPAEDVLDLVVAVVLVRLLGWHWAFLPSFVAELIPGVGLVPTWTAAVFLATRGRRPRA